VLPEIAWPSWFKRTFEYEFDLGEVDSQYLERVAESAKRRGGEILASDREALKFRISTLNLSKYHLVRLFSLGGLMTSLIILRLDEKKQCHIVVQNTSKKILYRLCFGIFSLCMALILLKDGRFLDLAEALIVILVIYVFASRLPSTNEYPRLKSYFREQKS
jgi:O-antigen ligase